MIKEIFTSPQKQTATHSVSRHEARMERALMLGKVAKMVLFFYVISLFKPVMPIVTDMIAHTFYEQQHIMEVHEVSGQFHIHQELANSLHQSDKERSLDTNYELTQYIHVDPYTFRIFQHTFCRGLYLTYSRFYPISSQDIEVPPPQLA